MICLASESSAVVLLSSAPVTLSSALSAFVWSVGPMRLEEPLPDVDAGELAEFWERGGATRSMFALLSASLSFPVATYISTDSWITKKHLLTVQRLHWPFTNNSIHAGRSDATSEQVWGLSLPDPVDPSVLPCRLWNDESRSVSLPLFPSIAHLSLSHALMMGPPATALIALGSHDPLVWPFTRIKRVQCSNIRNMMRRGLVSHL